MPEEWASFGEQGRRGREEALADCPAKQGASEQGLKPHERGRAQMEELVTKGPNRFEREEVKVLLEETVALERTEKAGLKSEHTKGRVGKRNGLYTGTAGWQSPGKGTALPPGDPQGI